jgi:hypothetical protein
VGDIFLEINNKWRKIPTLTKEACRSNYVVKLNCLAALFSYSDYSLFGGLFCTMFYYPFAVNMTEFLVGNSTSE